MDQSGQHFQQVEDFLAQYTEAFLSLEPARIAEFYRAPCLSVSSKEVLIYPSDEDVLSNFTKVAGDFRALGVRGIWADLRSVRSYGPDLLDIRVSWRVRFATGDAEKSLDNVYVLRREEGKLKIASVLLVA